jgi:hypothetical protein
MKKCLILMALCLPTIANASYLNISECTQKEQAKMYAIGIGSSVAVGALIGAATAAVMPVGAVGGPMAISYFPGTAVYGAWMTKSVIPLMSVGGIYSGVLGGLVTHGFISTQCEKALKRK